MLYESQGIFPEGWALDFREEARGITHQHATSKRSPKPKGGGRSNCYACGNSFTVTKGAVGKYCSIACMYKSKIESRPIGFDCSKCLALIGLGMGVVTRILHIQKSTLSRAWTKEGIRAQVPACGSWRQYAQRAKSPVCGWWGNAETAAMWISEYSPRFPDWSAVWHKEKARRNALTKPSQYQMMTKEQRLSHNKKVMERRIKRWKENPQIKERDRISMKLWKKQNPEKAKESARKAARKMRSNPINRIAFNMRSRFKEIMNGVRHSPTRGKWALIGCSQEDLKRHLEKGFNKKMSWSNYGSFWHVDHILPCSSFDHTDPKQVAQCWHWTNLQALQSAQNISKSNKITEPQMSLLLCATH
jgi:hypothetical protein